jgi:steroid delta-isomerase-like uncharacterized protein
MPKDPETIMRRLVDEVINGGDLKVIEELVAEGYVDHTGAEGGRQGYRELVSYMRAVFPDIHMTIHDIFSSGDRVAARFTVEATHQGEFLGLPATGKRVSWEGIGILRVKDGKMAERWNVTDIFGLVEQIKDA